MLHLVASMRRRLNNMTTQNPKANITRQPPVMRHCACLAYSKIIITITQQRNQPRGTRLNCPLRSPSPIPRSTRRGEDGRLPLKPSRVNLVHTFDLFLFEAFLVFFDDLIGENENPVSFLQSRREEDVSLIATVDKKTANQKNDKESLHDI